MLHMLLRSTPTIALAQSGSSILALLSAEYQLVYSGWQKLL